MIGGLVGSRGAREVVTMAVSDPADRSVGAVGERFARDLADVLRPVTARLYAELSEPARRAGLGGGLLVGAGLVTVLGIGSASIAVLRLLESVLPPGPAAGILAGGLLFTAGVLAVAGMRQLRPAARFAQDVRQVAAAVRAGLRGA
jgi:hypothetical protein